MSDATPSPQRAGRAALTGSLMALATIVEVYPVLGETHAVALFFVLYAIAGVVRTPSSSRWRWLALLSVPVLLVTLPSINLGAVNMFAGAVLTMFGLDPAFIRKETPHGN